MRLFFIIFQIIILVLGASAQEVVVTHISLKQSNVQNWFETEWVKTDNITIDVYSDHFLLIVSNDTTTIQLLALPTEMETNKFYTEGVVTTTGETIRIKFNFNLGYLSQIYLLVVPRTTNLLLNNYAIVGVDSKLHEIIRISPYVQYWDIAMQLQPNEIKP